MRVRESFLRDLLRLFAWYPFRWLAERLPPGLAVRVFRALGDAHWALAPGKRRLLARNLGRLGIAADQASRAVRENFRIHYVSQLLVFLYPRLTRTSLGELAAVAGLEHLDAALAQGRGVVLVQAHFGPEQLALAALSLLGHQVVQIGCANDAGLSAVGRGVSLRLRRRYEARIPGRIIDARTSLLPALRALRANGLVLTAGDGAGWARRLGRHVPVTLGGQELLFPVGPGRLALGSGAALLPLFVVRGEGTPFTVVIEPPLARPRDLSGEAAETALAVEFARRYERRLLVEPGFMRFLELFTPGELLVADASGQVPGDTRPGSPGPCAPS